MAEQDNTKDQVEESSVEQSENQERTPRGLDSREAVQRKAGKIHQIYLILNFKKALSLDGSGQLF